MSESDAKGGGWFWKDAKTFQIHSKLDMLILKHQPCGFRSCGLDYMKFKPYVSSGLWPGISSPCFILLKVLRKVV